MTPVPRENKNMILRPNGHIIDVVVFTKAASQDCLPIKNIEGCVEII
jgi:hypothetical protein